MDWLGIKRSYEMVAAWDAADEQRKRYFDSRMKMKSLPNQDILDHIKEYGTKRFDSYMDTKWNGIKLMDMSWDELALIVHEIVQEKKLNAK